MGPHLHQTPLAATARSTSFKTRLKQMQVSLRITPLMAPANVSSTAIPMQPLHYPQWPRLLRTNGAAMTMGAQCPRSLEQTNGAVMIPTLTAKVAVRTTQMMTNTLRKPATTQPHSCAARSAQAAQQQLQVLPVPPTATTRAIQSARTAVLMT